MDVTYDGKDHNELSPDAGVSREESAPHVEHAYAGFGSGCLPFCSTGLLSAASTN